MSAKAVSTQTKATPASAALDRVLIKGNDAVVYGALDAGCRCYFGYPITPQNEIPEGFARELPPLGGQFVQAESEVAAVNMVLGAGACGVLAMTSSSGCGISLMQEGISYMAGSCIPGVIVNMQRGGPGLGDIGPAQGDYFQAVKGGGHGDHRNLVLAPATAQECYDFMFWAFVLAFKYANPVMLLGDAVVGQIKEPVRRQRPATALAPAAMMDFYAASRLEGIGVRGPDARPRVRKSVYLGEGELAAHNRMLEQKYAAMRAETLWEEEDTADAELILVAFGSVARSARSVMRSLRQEGRKVGLFRPLTLFPFPDKALADLATAAQASGSNRRFLVMEQNLGQMVEDVRLAVGARAQVLLHCVMPGLFIGADDLLAPVLDALEGN